jgi:hypothetical protein
MRNNFLKAVLYILSLWLLFFSLSIMSYDREFISKILDIDFSLSWNALKTFDLSFMKSANYVFVLSVFFMMAGVLSLLLLYMGFLAGWSATYALEDVCDENHEHLAFLTTYIMPLVFTDVDKKRTAINLAVMIIAIGIIYVKANKFYSNPSLAVLGYRIYKAQIKFQSNKTFVLVCHGRLKNDSKIQYIKLDEDTLLVREIS